MIAAIRIRGTVDVTQKVEATLDRLRLKRKYSCVLLEESREKIGMLRKAENYVAYGKIDKTDLKLLIEKRARALGNKPIDKSKLNDKLVEDIMNGKSLQSLGIKPFFRLHPPRGGFKRSIKLLYPQGIMGKNPDTSKILIKML